MTATLLASCGASAPIAPPRQEPPARVLVVDLDRIALRESAAAELLATRSGANLDGFVATEWRNHATASRQAVDAVVAAFGPEAEALLERVATDLAVDWPEARVVVDVVTASEPADASALVPPLLAARGRCFARGKREDDKMYSARVIDCVLVYALRGLIERSALALELGRLLPRDEAARAWELLVVHAAAATVASWEPKHEAVLRQSAAAVEPAALAWLADNWRSRAVGGESVPSFASRYAAALRESGAHGRTEP